jgi:hypothetical protein
LKNLKQGNLVLDGEIVALDEQGSAGTHRRGGGCCGPEESENYKTTDATIFSARNP